jgi:hypothetical protein
MSQVIHKDAQYEDNYIRPTHICRMQVKQLFCAVGASKSKAITTNWLS